MEKGYAIAPCDLGPSRTPIPTIDAPFLYKIRDTVHKIDRLRSAPVSCISYRPSLLGVSLLDALQHPLQVLKALGDTLDAVLGTLEFDGAIAVVAGSLEDLQALLHVAVALARDGTLEVVTATSLAVAGQRLGGLIHILGMDVDGVGGDAGNGGGVVLVGTDEVANVYQETVVIMSHGVEKLLHAVGVLGDIAVVLGTGLDALLCGVFGDGTGIGGDGGEHEAEGTGVARLTCAVADIMAHDGTAQDGGDIHLSLEAFDLGGALLGSVTVEVGADGVGIDGHAVLVGLGAERMGIGHLLLVGGCGQVYELNGLKAHVVGLLDDVDMGELARVDVLLEGIGADGDFHDVYFPFLGRRRGPFSKRPLWTPKTLNLLFS